MMNRTVAKIFLILYFVVFVVVFWGFQFTDPHYPGGVDGLYKFGPFLSPIPSILMSLIYAAVITNFLFLLINTALCINIQFVTFLIMFFGYAVLCAISYI
jgi:hypothetical protein